MAVLIHAAVIIALVVNVSLDKPSRPDEGSGDIMHATFVPPAKGNPNGGNGSNEPAAQSAPAPAPAPEPPKAEEKAQEQVAEDLKYFHSRPRGSQIGAWASHQSHLVSSRGILEAKFQELKEKFKSGEIPLPSFWGGFRVKFHTVEFWQGRENRMHDRFIYHLGDANKWMKPERLAP